MSRRTIRICHEDISALPHPKNSNIVTKNQPTLFIIAGVVQAPHALHSPAVQEIVVDAALNRTGPTRTLRQFIRTVLDGTNPDLSDICGTSASPPSGDLWSPGIVNKQKPNLPNLCKSDELDAVIDKKITNNTIEPPVIAQLFSDKLFDSHIRDIYARCGMHLAKYPVHTVATQFVTH